MGSKYAKEFIAGLRQHTYTLKHSLDNLDDVPYDIYIEADLGLRLYHAGINPNDEVHYRHQIYLVVEETGKASKLCPAGKIIANVLTTQYASEKDLFDALLKSVDRRGLCVLVGNPTRVDNKCGDCGHELQRRAHYESHLFRPDETWITNCCKWNAYFEQFECCHCKRGSSARLTPIDTDAVAAMPATGLPIYPKTPTEPDPAPPSHMQGSVQNFYGPSQHYHLHLPEGGGEPRNIGELDWPRNVNNLWDPADGRALDGPRALGAKPPYKTLTGRVTEVDDKHIEEV